MASTRTSSRSTSGQKTWLKIRKAFVSFIALNRFDNALKPLSFPSASSCFFLPVSGSVISRSNHRKTSVATTEQASTTAI
jgi:hypothetical protein